MIVYGITPLKPAPGKAPALSTSGVYERLFVKPSRTESLHTIDTEADVVTADGFTLRVRRNQDGADSLHPIDALIYELNAIRRSTLPDVLRIPGQAFSNSYTSVDKAPAEGVAVVLCGQTDWDREVEDTELNWDPIPAIHPLRDRSTTISYKDAGRDCYVTADARGLIIDYELEFDHADFGEEDTVDEEASAFLIDFAVQHAIRSIDIARAAESIDILGNHKSDSASRQEALDTLRTLQLRMAARGVESLLENREWQSFIGHDAFRMSAITRRESARLDRDLSEQFTSIQPVIEASDADLQKRSANERESRIKRVTGLAGAVLGGAALLGLFAALAAIPAGTDVAFSPYVRAAFATLTLGAIVAGYAWLLQWALPTVPKRSAGVLRLTGGAALVLGVLLAGVGWFWSGAPPIALLVASVACSMLGILALIYASGGSTKTAQQ